MQETVNLDAWSEATKEHEAISVEDLDKSLIDYEKAKTQYEIKKKESSELYAEAEKKKNEMISLMERAGKTKWETEGIGKVSIVEKLTIRVPKDLNQKQKMFDCVANRVTPEVFHAMLTIHSTTLNSFYKQECENDPNFRIEGLEEGSVDKQLRISRSKK